MTTPRYAIRKDIFQRLETLDGFREEVQAFYADLVVGTGLRLEFCPFRQKWAHQFYMEDLARIEGKLNGTTPNHYKRCGVLAFWLRREPPVSVWNDTHADFANLPPRLQSKHDFLIQYGREWGAFNFAYQICLFYECNKPGQPLDRGSIDRIDSVYCLEMVEMLKRNNVSPHSLHMIYKSLFLRKQKLG